MLPLYFLLICASINVSFSYDTTNANDHPSIADITIAQSAAKHSTIGDDTKDVSSVQENHGDSWEILSPTSSTADGAEDAANIELSNTKKPSRQEMMNRWSFLREEGRYPSTTETPTVDAAEAFMPSAIEPNASEEPPAHRERFTLDVSAIDGMRNTSSGVKERRISDNCTIQDESKQPEMWNIRYIRKDDSEVEHYLVNMNATWRNAKRFCKKMKMQLAEFEDHDEPGFVLESLRRKCSYCTTAWINGVNDRSDGSTCKSVHVQGEEAGMIRCHGRNKLTRKRIFLCTRKISRNAKGIKIEVMSIKKETITHIFFAKPATWKEAYNSCESRGYRLGVFDSVRELERVLDSYLKICSGCGGLYWISTPPWSSYEKAADEADQGEESDENKLYKIMKKLCKKANSLTCRKKSFSRKKGREIAQLLRKAYWASNPTRHAGRLGKFCDGLLVDGLKLVPLECDTEPDMRRSDSPRGYVCTKI